MENRISRSQTVKVAFYIEESLKSKQKMSPEKESIMGLGSRFLNLDFGNGNRENHVRIQDFPRKNGGTKWKWGKYQRWKGKEKDSVVENGRRW